MSVDVGLSVDAKKNFVPAVTVVTGVPSGS